MKRTLTILSAAILTTALATPLMAQTAVAPVNTNYGEHHQNVEGFDSYLDQHPDERKELARDPHLIDNPKYLEKHPDLQGYMHEHPHQSEAFKSHPSRFEHREHVYNRSERHYDRHHGIPVKENH
jgi:hypothetical protein